MPGTESSERPVEKTTSPGTGSSECPAEKPGTESSECPAEKATPPGTGSSRSKRPSTSESSQKRVPQRCAPEVWATDLIQALLAQHLPPLLKYTGEDQSKGETFRDWLKQFELVASIGDWDDKTKLVNPVTRLWGQAYAFYRSCTLQQRANYATHVAELTKRFIPVQIQAVQSSLFHDRKQKPRKTVDSYAQDLRQLFHKAYPTVQSGTREAEAMGQVVLANQFAAGLLPELKRKIAGTEGKFKQLLVQARFEEAKLRELTGSRVDGSSTNHPRIHQRPITRIPWTSLAKG